MCVYVCMCVCMYVFGNISSAWIETKLPCYWFENISVYVYGMNQAVFCLLIATFEIANRKATKAQYTSDLATTDAPTDGMSDMEPDPEKRTSKRRVIYSSDSSPKKTHKATRQHGVQYCPSSAVIIGELASSPCCLAGHEHRNTVSCQCRNK